MTAVYNGSFFWLPSEADSLDLDERCLAFFVACLAKAGPGVLALWEDEASCLSPCRRREIADAGLRWSGLAGFALNAA